ncbi:MAG: AtpZ/AtpI family protein [Acidobacteriota bacterium]
MSLLNSQDEPERSPRRSLIDKIRPPEVITLFEDPENSEEKEPFILSEAPSGSAEETARRSGLAFSAGVAFFSSVVFMLVLGWLADLFLGSSPWGIVFGIVLGAVIGFIQLFRTSSQIFKKQ